MVIFLYLIYIHQQRAAQATELQVELYASLIRCDIKRNWYQIRLSVGPLCWKLGALTSYPIRKFAGWACDGNAGNVSTPPLVSDPDMHHGTCEMHVPWCVPGSLTSGSLWSRWQEKVPGIPGACATRTFAYLVRGPWWGSSFISDVTRSGATIYHERTLNQWGYVDQRSPYVNLDYSSGTVVRFCANFS